MLGYWLQRWEICCAITAAFTHTPHTAITFLLHLTASACWIRSNPPIAEVVKTNIVATAMIPNKNNLFVESYIPLYYLSFIYHFILLLYLSITPLVAPPGLQSLDLWGRPITLVPNSRFEILQSLSGNILTAIVAKEDETLY